LAQQQPKDEEFVFGMSEFCGFLDFQPRFLRPSVLGFHLLLWNDVSRDGSVWHDPTFDCGSQTEVKERHIWRAQLSS